VAGQRFNGRKILVAAGSKPRPLGIPGGELAITSDGILDMKRRPASLLRGAAAGDAPAAAAGPGSAGREEPWLRYGDARWGTRTLPWIAAFIVALARAGVATAEPILASESTELSQETRLRSLGTVQ